MEDSRADRWIDGTLSEDDFWGEAQEELSIFEAALQVFEDVSEDLLEI